MQSRCRHRVLACQRAYDLPKMPAGSTMCGKLRGGSHGVMALLLLLSAASASCPYQAGQLIGTDRLLPSPHDHTTNPSLPQGGYEAVKEEIKTVLTNSRDFWPADNGHYGPFFIRLAWHCSGSYRLSDGRGGCDGGRIRFNPEHSWMDNTNLDKALRVLEPIKLKFGASLSWGDLIALAGTTAIESMGGPVLGFCGGRIDDSDGYSSLELGPSKEQEAIAPCEVNGQCTPPLGPTTIGLIYVNPEGPMGKPDPAGSAVDIRSSFSRMGWSDAETVALIGGGHAFGKAHGACNTGPGPDPTQDPIHPWPGTCGTGPTKGKGNNTFTSGFEGAWTTQPTKWSNEYFVNLLEYDWEKHTGPGGHFQWKPVSRTGAAVDKSIMMMTSDVALLHDDAYLEHVRKFAADTSALEDAFAHAWYKLTSSDMGPVTRCLGNSVPPAQPFQMPLPSTPSRLADFSRVRTALRKLLKHAAPGADTAPDGTPYFGALFVYLAHQCASTFRATDYRGGCNGARIRFSPQKDWPANVGMGDVLGVLADVKAQFDSGSGALSWSDLIVLAGQTALEEAGGSSMTFCGGRVDADSGDGSRDLAPRAYADAILTVRDNMKVMGLTAHEAVALAGRIRSPTQQKRLGFSGSYTTDPTHLSNSFYQLLLTEDWVEGSASENASDKEYRAAGKEVYVTASDLALVWDSEMRAIVQEFAGDQAAFTRAFTSAWTKLMIADRFDGPSGNVCK